MKKTLLLLLCIAPYSLVADNSSLPFYFVTAVNNAYMKPLLSLIGGIHKNDFEDLGEILVFNLGLSKKNIALLESIEKVKVYEVEQTHPDILKPVKTRKGGKFVPGWYAWKPVAIKQALDLYPCVLWIDAGVSVYKSLKDLFTHIQNKGYFFHSPTAYNLLKNRTTRYVIDLFNLHVPENKWILHTHGLEANLIGATRAIYETIIMPMYQMAKELRAYIDDGTVPGGFGEARHDQPLFSILVLKNKLHIHYEFKTNGNMMLEQENGTKTPFVVHKKNNGALAFTRSHHEYDYFKDYIRYKERNS